VIVCLRSRQFAVRPLSEVSYPPFTPDERIPELYVQRHICDKVNLMTGIYSILRLFSEVSQQFTIQVLGNDSFYRGGLHYTTIKYVWTR